MTTLNAAQPHRTDIEFDQLSSHEWRVSDRRFPRHSIDSLLGFVARNGDEYLVTRIDRPGDARSHATLDAVAGEFID